MDQYPCVISWLQTQDTYIPDSDSVCQGHWEGFQSLNTTERQPWNCLFHFSETKAFRAVTLFFCCFQGLHKSVFHSTLNLSLVDVKWVINYLTTLRQPSLRVEGASFKSAHFHFYRPHAALQHKVPHYFSFSFPAQQMFYYSQQGRCTFSSAATASWVADLTSSPLTDRIWSPCVSRPSVSTKPPLTISDTNTPVSFLVGKSERKRHDNEITHLLLYAPLCQLYYLT